MIARGSWVRTGGGAPVLVALVFRVLRARMWLRQLAREWPQRRGGRGVISSCSSRRKAQQLASWVRGVLCPQVVVRCPVSGSAGDQSLE